MIRVLGTFVWLRWRLLVNGLGARGSRDALERASRAGGLAIPILLMVSVVPFTLLLGFFGFAGGFRMGKSGAAHREFLVGCRIVLAVLTFAVLLGPLFRSIHGSTTSLVRLALLPIPRRALHLFEVAAAVLDPWLVLVAPGVFLVALGLAAAGALYASVVTLVAAAGLVCVLLLLASAIAFVVQIAFRDRRRGEVLMLVGAFVLSFGSLVPALLGPSIEAGSVGTGSGSGPGAWAWVLPSELYASSLRLGVERSWRGVLPLAGLAVLGAAIYAISWRTYRALMDSPAEGSSRRRGCAIRAHGWRLIGLTPAASAIAWVQVRGVLRTVTGKIVVFLNPFCLAIAIALLPRLAGDELPLHRLPLDRGVLLAAAGVFFTLLSLERVLLNQFGADGAGLILELLAPISDGDLVAGKMAGGAILAGASFVLYLAFAFAVNPALDPLLLGCVVLGGVSAYLLLGPVAAIVSAVLPKPGNLSRMGSASSAHPAASLLGVLLTLGLLAPPLALAAAGVLLGKSRVLACGLVGAWTGVAALLAVPLLRLARATVAARRENLAMVAQGR